MTVFSFPTGVDQLCESWTVDTFRFMMLTSSWAPDPTIETYVSDIVANEYAATGYSRVTAGTKTRSVTLPTSINGPGYVTFDCADPAFGVLSGGTVAAWLVLYQFVTGDADSPLVAGWPIDYTADAVTAATIPLSGNGAYRLATVCAGFLS